MLCAARHCLAAANQMHDFEAIASGNWRRFPQRSRNDLQISFHCQPIRGQPQVGYELFHVQPLGHFTRLAIDLHS